MNKEKKISIFIAGLLWLFVGIRLSFTGLNWLLTMEMGPKLFLFFIIALAIGFAKGKFVLTKTSKKYLDRASVINFQKKDLYFGWAKIFGIKGAFLLGIMMSLGWILRHSSLDASILGVIYFAVGLALLSASMVFFKGIKST